MWPARLYDIFPHSHTGQGILEHVTENEGTTVAQWLRCCATNRKVAGSISDGVNGIFH